MKRPWPCSSGGPAPVTDMKLRLVLPLTLSVVAMAQQAVLVGPTKLGVPSDDILDTDARELVVDDRRVGLTPLEFAVMHYLHQREGKAVSRTSLIEDVWRYKYDVGSNVVDAVVKTLRKKLGKHSGIIETVPGYGYRFRRSQPATAFTA